MNEISAAVALMLDNYRDLIGSFATGEISADVFERDFLARFKNDPASGHRQGIRRPRWTFR